MEVSPDMIADAFKFAPAIVALLIVIYLQHGTITRLISGTQGDIERQTKILSLLEILVQRGASFRNGASAKEVQNERRNSRDDKDP